MIDHTIPVFDPGLSILSLVLYKTCVRRKIELFPTKRSIPDSSSQFGFVDLADIIMFQLKMFFHAPSFGIKPKMDNQKNGLKTERNANYGRVPGRKWFCFYRNVWPRTRPYPLFLSNPYYYDRWPKIRKLQWKGSLLNRDLRSDSEWN